MHSNQETMERFYSTSQKLLDLANSDITRINFLREISLMLRDFIRCNSIELWLNEESNYVYCGITKDKGYSFHYEIIGPSMNLTENIFSSQKENSILDYIKSCVVNKDFDASLPFFTKNGSFWINDTTESLDYIIKDEDKHYYHNMSIASSHESLALVPLFIKGKSIGVIQISREDKNFFNEKFIELLEGLAKVLVSALFAHHTQIALRERVKELSCLYNIAQVVVQPGINLEQILQSIVEFLPSAWQYPEVTVARIIFDRRVYATSIMQKGWQKLTADIYVKDKQRGLVEVFYTKVKPQLDEGPFLREERNLINVIARQLALIIENKETEEAKLKVEQQLMHADRLATLGQLGAGVAHELNEPLGNILGFAQLIEKSSNLTPQVSNDIEKIINSVLYARDVIKKLLLFAREMPPKVERVDLNKLIEEGLFFFEARCIKAGIELIRILSPENPEILGDKSQLNQTLINLVVNAMQAMPEGGRLTIETGVGDNYVSLSVIDTGIGMSDDVKEKIFLPFFTTKDVNEGTGLGLSVIHGIVTSHKGTIHFDSKLGVGTRFEIHFPKYFQKS